MNTQPKSFPAQPFHVLIAAAGSGTRFGNDTPKQYQKINGKTVLRHTIEAFLAHPDTASIHVIIDPEHADLYHDTVHGLDIAPYIKGSNTRNKSINNGIEALSNLKGKDIILIHDAARPLISTEKIGIISRESLNKGACTLATPVTDTMKYADQNANINANIARKNAWNIQTPQAFHYGLIKQAHEQNTDPTITDDTSLIQALGHKVTLIEGDKTNIKITTKDDLELVRAIMKTNQKTETRTGMGYDVHAFKKLENSSGQIRLCGIDIPHDRSLKGHSDADVGLHTITDAILGAISEGDIGTHFPPSNNDFKNMDSAIFLEHAIKLTQEKGAKINNIDLTLICEEPKIGPHNNAMIARIAEITGLAPGRISVKATTSERLGFTGRKEGIAAQAVATIEIPTPSEE